MAVKYGLTKEEQEELRAARAQKSDGGGEQEQSQNSRYDRTTNRMRYGLSKAEQQYFSKSRSDKRKAEIQQINQSAGWRTTAYTKARERTASAYDSYNSLVEDYQALFDENKMLRADKADRDTVSALLSRADALYKERTSGTSSGLRAMQDSLRSIQARNVMWDTVSAIIPDNVERAISKAEESAAKVHAGAAAIPGLPGDRMKWADAADKTMEQRGASRKWGAENSSEVPRAAEAYTAENVGDYMNRAAYLLSLPEWTDEQKQEAKSIQRAITAPPMADSYLKRLGQEDSEEAAVKAKEASEIADELGYRISPFAAAATALGGSFVRGTGLPSLAQAAGAALGIDSWVQEIDRFNQRVNQASSTGTGAKIASGIGGTIGGLTAFQSAAGLAGKAAGAIQGFSSLTPMMQGAAKTAITFMLTDAARGAGDVATGKTDIGSYAESVVESGLGGAAGSVASAMVTSGIAQSLIKHNLQTPFMEFLRQLSGGTVFAAASTGTEYAFQDPEERPSAEAVAQQMATAFLFSVINSSISTVQTTRANRARMEAAVQKMQQDYQNMAQGAMSQEEMQQAAQRMMRYSGDIRSALDQNYYAGQQDYIDQVRSALDVIDDYVANAAGGTDLGAEAPLLSAGSAGAESAAGGMIVSPAGGGGGAGGMIVSPEGGGGAAEAETMAREIQAAVASGLEDANNLRSLEQSAPPVAAEPAQDMTARVEALYQEFGNAGPEPKTQEERITERADALYREFGGKTEDTMVQTGAGKKPQSAVQEAGEPAAQTFRAEQRERQGAEKTGQGTARAAQAETARNAAQMTAKTGKAGTSVRGTDVVKAVKVGENDIVIQKTDGSTASINTLDQRGTALEVLQFAKELPDYRDAMTVNGMMRAYESYLGSTRGNRSIAERFFDNYVIAVAAGAEGESLADALGVTTDRKMQTAMESGWRRGVEIAKGRRISMEMGSAGQAAMEQYGYLYPQMFSDFYRAGAQGATFQQAMEAAGVKSLGEIKKTEMKAAWKAGRKDGMDYEVERYAVSDAGGQRENGLGAGGKAGSLEAGTGGSEGREGGRVGRRGGGDAENRTSLKKLGVKSGTDAPQEVVSREKNEHGGEIITVSDRLLVRGQDGTEREVQAIQSGNNVILRADDPMMEQHKAHELEHIRQRSMTDEEITAVFREKTKSLSDKRLRRILSAYALDYYGLYGGDDTTMADLYREYLADEAAGIRHNETDQDVIMPGAQTGMTDRRGETYAMRGNQRTEYEKPITAQDVAVLRSIGRKSIHAFTSEDIEKAKKWAYKFYQDIGVKSPFFRAWFGDWRANQTTDFVAIAKIPKYVGTNEARKEQRGIVKNSDTGWDIRISREGETNTISHAGQKRLSEYGLAGIRSLIENAYLFDTEVHEHHSNNDKNDLIAFDHKFYSLGRDTGGNIALYKITVEESYHDAKNTNERRFHNLKYVEKVATVGGRTAGQSLHGVSTNDDIATDFSIADLYDLVKRFDREFTAGREANPMLLNEDGTPKMFYHGAKKNGGFTEFRDWQYFTEQKQYANRYAERGNPDALYAVYLTAEKVFDTRDAKAARIFREIRQEYGLGELQDTGLPDWTDGYDITDYLEEHPELGYDAILLDEGGDLVNGKPVSRGFSIVIRNSSQVKSATNNIGTFDRGNKDIRYAVSEPQSSAEYAQTQRASKQREALMEQSTKQTFELRRQFTEGTERDLSASDLPGIAADLRRIYGKKSMKQIELQERLEHIATVKARERSPMEAYRRAKDEADILAADMIRNALGQTSEAEDDWNGIKATFRSGGKPVKLFIDGANRMDLEAEGGYEGMRKRLMGYAFLSSGGVPVDVFYQEELSSRFPGYFPASIQNPADQLIRIVSVIDQFRAIFRSPYAGSMAEDTEMLSQDILQRLYNSMTPSGNAAAFAEQHEDMVRAYYETKLQSTRDAWKKQVEQMKQSFADKQQEQQTAREERKLQEQLLHIAQRLDRVRVGSEWKSKAEELVGALDTAARSLTGKTIIGDYIGNVSSEGIETVRTNEKGQKVVTLDALREFVSRQQAENPDFLPDQKTMDKIKRLDKVQISDLTIGEIRNLLNAMQNLENEMRVSKKLIDAADRRDVAIQAEEVRADISSSQGVSPTGVKKAWSNLITTQSLSPVRFLRRITGYKDNDPLYRAGQAMQDGETAMLDYQRRAEAKFRSFQENKTFMESLSGKKSKAIEITGRTEDGIQTMKITPDMRIAIYLHSKNSENVRHAERGGMVVPNYDLLMKGKTEEAYEQGTILYLTRSQMHAVGNGMTAMERNYANAIWEYFNTFSKDEINKVSRALLGYDIAVVRNYYPIEVNRKFTRAEPDAVKHDAKIESSGFTKSRTGAANTINLRGATETLERAMTQHAKYVGLAIPVRNFGKLYGNTSWSISPDPDDPREIQTVTSSVRDVLDRKWGSAAGRYIDKLMADIQNPVTSDGKWSRVFGKIRSNYAGAVLTLNLSVAMKQAASYPTAAAVVGWKPLAQAMTNWKTADLDRIAKYTPLLWYRSKGYSTKELGDLAKGNRSLPWFLNWVQGIDVATTKKLWKAAEYYVRDNQKGLTIGSDDYYKAVAEIYNRIILETQPNYTTMERPNLLRENDTLLQNLSMFKTQPLQNLNIAYDAVENLRAKERQLKAARDAAKNDPAAAEQVQAAERVVREAKRNAANGISALLVSGAVFSAMTLLWNLFRGNKKKYQNDGEEVTALSFLKGFGGDMLSSFAGMAPFGSDVYEVVWSAMTGDTYYGMEALTPSAISDFLETIVKVPDNVQDVVSAFQGDKSAVDVFWSVDQLAVAASKLLGIPVENVQNLMKAVSLNVMKTTMPEEEADYWYRYYTTKTSASKRRSKDYADIYASAKAGNMDGYQEMRGKMEGWIWKENDSYQSGDISREEARERATETVNGAMQDRIQEEFLSGTMQEKEAKELLTEIAGFDKDDQRKLDETVLHWACERDTGIKYDDLKDAYLGGEISGKKAAKYLAKYGWHEEGMTEVEITEEAEATVQKWDYQDESGNGKASASRADKYYEFAEPAGINISVFDEAYTFASNVEADKDKDGESISGSAKQKVVDYILGLGLSSEQERALWNAVKGNWSDKDTPWR